MPSIMAEGRLANHAESLEPPCKGGPVLLPSVETGLYEALWEATSVAFRSLGSVG